MQVLTIQAKVVAHESEQSVLLDAMRCATKVYNGLLWHLREEFRQTGKTNVSRKHMNAILSQLPRAKAYYSLSAQATRDEVIQAYKGFFALRKAGRTQHQMPGFRREAHLSPLRYYNGFGFTLDGDRLTLSLGIAREDGVRSVSVILQMRRYHTYGRIVNLLLTYDNDLGLRAHLVVEVPTSRPMGNRKVAVDLGETQAISALFDDGTALLYSGKQIKAIRRYWQKVRAKVRPPTAENRHKSRRFRQIQNKESRQVRHLLHIMTTDFVRRCWRSGVGVIAIGDVTGIKDLIDCGRHLNQRLHAWPYGTITRMIKYKAALYGMQVVPVDEAYSSRACHACGLVDRKSRKHRGHYACECGWQVQADVNGAANLLQRAFNVSPLRSSGCVAHPVVMPIRLTGHTVHETKSRVASTA